MTFFTNDENKDKKLMVMCKKCNKPRVINECESHLKHEQTCYYCHLQEQHLVKNEVKTL